MLNESYSTGWWDWFAPTASKNLPLFFTDMVGTVCPPVSSACSSHVKNMETGLSVSIFKPKDINNYEIKVVYTLMDFKYV